MDAYNKTLTNHTIIPPSCLGLMGGGQLARMFAITAKQMGYKIAILEPDEMCPASYFADYHIKSSYTDIDGLTKLATLAAVITTEFEKTPTAHASKVVEEAINNIQKLL